MPGDPIPNSALLKDFRLPAGWIERHTGIHSRHRAGANETTSDLAAEAARRALDDAGCTPEELDRLILATISPDWPTPATACAVQAKIGARRPSEDKEAACAMGLCAGIPAYIASLADLVFMVRDKGYLFTASPAVIKVATGEEVDIKDLGGAEMHATVSGVAHLLVDSEQDAMEALRAILGYRPAHNREDPPLASTLAPPPVDWSTVVPADPFVPFDVRDLIEALTDRASFFELHRDWGRSIVVGLALLGGRSVGIVANQSLEGAGALDVTSSRKAARFIRLCDAFNVPLVFLVDVPGFTPGLEQERAGLLLAGAQLYTAMDADVPRISVVTCKCYGGAYVMLNSKACGGDMVLAWPDARIAVVGAEAVCEILYRKEARRAEDPQAFRAERIKAFRDTWESAHAAAGRGIVDRVVRPDQTRAALLDSLELMSTKRVVDRPPQRLQDIPL